MFSFFSVVGWLGTDRLARSTPDRERVDRNCWHSHCAPLCALSLQPFMGRACKTISAMLRDYSVSDTPNTKDLDDNFLVQVAGFKCPCANSGLLGTCYRSVASLHNQPLTLSIYLLGLRVLFELGFTVWLMCAMRYVRLYAYGESDNLYAED